MKKKSNNLSLSLTIFLFVFIVRAQNPTIGLIFLDTDVSDGYTLYSPEINNNVYLINNCGEKINEWSFTEPPGATCYLLENGTLLRAGKTSLEIRDWNNNVLWRYEMDANGFNQHHDIEPLPNGNILCILRDDYSDIEMIANGKNPFNTASTVKLDKIIELQPVGTNEANVVWEWKFIDHFIQEYDNTKLNFDVVSNHPELIDINYFDTNVPNQDSDYTHVNAIDYNYSLDQIMISARHLNEIYIIDHSTTTIEASGHSGGNSNSGGDIIWRWGNPQVYGQGGPEHQKLYLQHDSKWVDSGYLDEGKISVFNNGGGGTNIYSSIHLITPEIINYIYTKENSLFKPTNFDWSWNGSIMGRAVSESKKSGVQSTQNGNLLICETSLGQISEITKTGKLLWTYKNPSGETIFNQFDNVDYYFNSIFRAEKYPINYIGFSGKDLTPIGIIENENFISNNCNILNVKNLEFKNFKILNPIKNGVVIFSEKITLDTLIITDINGRVVFKSKNFSDNKLIINIKPGLYFLKLNKKEGSKTVKIIFT